MADSTKTTINSSEEGGRADTATKDTGVPSVNIRIAHTGMPEKADSGWSVGDYADSAAAFFGALAALLALISIRQVRGMAATTQLRDARLATLDVLASGPMSLGHLSTPIADAIDARTKVVAAALIASHGAKGSSATIETAVRAGRVFDVSVPLTPDVLILFTDWYGSIASKEHRRDTAAYLNRLEETCTCVVRGILDLRILDKTYGTHLRSTYPEIAPVIYLHRRTSSYRTFDQLERTIDLLRASTGERFRTPGLFSRLLWCVDGRKRLLSRLLKQQAAGGVVDADQLEDGLIRSGLVDQEEAIRSTLKEEARCPDFVPTSRTGELAVRFPPRSASAHWVLDRGGGRPDDVLATVDVLQLAQSTVLKVGSTDLLIHRLLAAIPARLFRAAHLRSRGPTGAFDGPEAIYVCHVEIAVWRSSFRLLPVLRILKRELNTGRHRPFLVALAGTPSEIGDVQQTMFEEGGMLIHAHVRIASVEAVWLF